MKMYANNEEMKALLEVRTNCNLEKRIQKINLIYNQEKNKASFLMKCLKSILHFFDVRDICSSSQITIYFEDHITFERVEMNKLISENIKVDLEDIINEANLLNFNQENNEHLKLKLPHILKFIILVQTKDYHTIKEKITVKCIEILEYFELEEQAQLRDFFSRIFQKNLEVKF